MAGSYPSALRVKEFSYIIDSTWADIAGNGVWTLTDNSGPKDTTIYYRWFANGLPAYRMQLEVDAITNQVIGAAFYDNDFVLKTTSVESNNFQLYPNPTTGLITLKNVSNQQLSITNLMGEMVLAKTININSETIDLTELSAGIYFVKVTDKNGESLVKKVTKQ
jgi:Secretion system C-terminal sorting domain